MFKASLIRLSLKYVIFNLWSWFNCSQEKENIMDLFGVLGNKKFYEFFFYSIFFRFNRWVGNNLTGHPNFYSCSSDGAIINWTVLDTHLLATLVTIIEFSYPLKSEVENQNQKTGILYLPKMTYFCTKIYLEIILQPHSWCQKYSIQARWWNNVFGGNRRGWHSSLHHRIFFWVSHDIQVTCHSHQQIGVEWFLQ